MAEIIASLTGAIVGSVVTLAYTTWHERSSKKREQQILQNVLQKECQLQMAVLETLSQQYAQPQRVNPMRVSIDIFTHALNRQVGEFGDVGIIRALSQVILNVKALNTALERYEPELMKAMEDSRRLHNVERSRKGICNNIQLCMRVLSGLSTEVSATSVARD